MKNIHRPKPAAPVLVSNNYLQKLSQKLKNTKSVVRHILWISAAIYGKAGYVISFSYSQWVNTMVLPFAFWCNSSKLPKLACTNSLGHTVYIYIYILEVPSWRCPEFRIFNGSDFFVKQQPHRKNSFPIGMIISCFVAAWQILAHI